MESTSEYALIAERIAQESGEVLRKGGESSREIEYSDERDVKLKADQDSEVLITKRLKEATSFPVVGEEFGGDETLIKKNEYYWVVDPLDGTYNYLRGSAQCAVSIALLKGITPIVGVVYDFNADISYRGVANEGLFINGVLHQPKWATSIEQAAIATGFPAGMDKSPERMSAFVDRIQPYKKVRMIGTAALAMAHVAAGQYDVYYEETTRLWDFAAGAALIQAAGGVLKMTPSSSGKFLAYDVWGAGRAELIKE